MYCKMASIRDVIKDAQNCAFKTLKEAITEQTIFTKGIDSLCVSTYLQFMSTQLNKLTENEIIVQLYGSTAEDLRCIESYDLGDMDIMFYPNSDNLIIREKRLQYSLENPLHVKIKGGHHPVLQCCHVEDAEYVATAALKNCHPEIFGKGFSNLFELITHYFQALSQEEFPSIIYSPLKNSATSPAVTLNITDSSKSGFSVEIMEFMAHLSCIFSGTNYTRQQAENLDKFYLFLKEIKTAVNPISVLDKMLCCLFRSFGVEAESQIYSAELRDFILGLKGFLTPKKSDEEESERSYCADVVVTPKNCNLGQNISKLFEGIFRPSTMPKVSAENSSRSSVKPGTSTQSTNSKAVEDNGMKRKNGSFKGNSETVRQPLKQKEWLTSKVQLSNQDRKGGEIKDLDSIEIYQRYTKHLIGTGPDTKKAESQELTEFKETKGVLSGYDFIPAFKSRGWPKVAREWINRERKWPSPDIVDKIVQEGFHLVVKSPKNNGNPECDFRISFSHAEYLLSKEMNPIQRGCYRWLKRYHRANLSTQPKSLVSFHLKNIFLQTIEETGADMWTEDTVAYCMMWLLGNLLQALKRKTLSHYFVKSYNLFGVDYIANPEVLQSLAGKVEQILESPIRFLQELIQMEENRAHSYDAQDKKKEVTVPLKPTEATPEQDGGPVSLYRYHDLKDIYQEVNKELLDMAFKDVDCRLETIDPLERSIVKDLRELERKYNLGDCVGKFQEFFDNFWDLVGYHRAWINPEPDLRRRMLDAIQNQVEIIKHVWKQDGFPDFANISLYRIVQDLSFDLNHTLPSGFFMQLMHRFYDNFFVRQAQAQLVNANVDDIPLD